MVAAWDERLGCESHREVLKDPGEHRRSLETSLYRRMRCSGMLGLVAWLRFGRAHSYLPVCGGKSS